MYRYSKYSSLGYFVYFMYSLDFCIFKLLNKEQFILTLNSKSIFHTFSRNLYLQVQRIIKGEETNKNRSVVFFFFF